MKPMATKKDDFPIDLDKWFGRAMLFGAGAAFVLMIDIMMAMKP